MGELCLFDNGGADVVDADFSQGWAVNTARAFGAEFLVAADLAFCGYGITMARSGAPFDLIADLGTELFKVQVKSSFRPKYCSRGFGTSKLLAYEFEQRGKYDGQVLAYVASDRRLILYERPVSIAHWKRIPPKMFTLERQELSRRQVFLNEGIELEGERHEAQEYDES